MCQTAMITGQFHGVIEPTTPKRFAVQLDPAFVIVLQDLDRHFEACGVTRPADRTRQFEMRAQTRQRLAVFLRQQVRQLALARLKRRRQCSDGFLTLRIWQSRPRGIGRLGRADRLIEIVFARICYRADHRSCGGVQDGKSVLPGDLTAADRHAKIQH